MKWKILPFQSTTVFSGRSFSFLEYFMLFYFCICTIVFMSKSSFLLENIFDICVCLSFIPNMFLHNIILKLKKIKSRRNSEKNNRKIVEKEANRYLHLTYTRYLHLTYTWYLHLTYTWPRTLKITFESGHNHNKHNFYPENKYIIKVSS